jgi:hypothetical protein
MKKKPNNKMKSSRGSYRSTTRWLALQYLPMPARLMTRCLPFFRENEV